MTQNTNARKVWLLPIVLVVCAVMLLPAGAIGTAVHGGTAGASAPSPASRASTSTAFNPNSVTDVLNQLASPTGSGPASAAPSVGAAKSPQLYAKALDQIASQPGFTDGGALQALASQIAAGKVSPSSVYLPNLNLLASGPHSPGQAVGPGYTANPAPMGIGDFGLGSGSPYTYYTPHFAGSLTLNASNATYPGAYYFISPPGSTNGSYNTPYEYGIQLNTVLNNISIPGNDQSSWWTQNVVALDGNQLQFEDNVWNFTGQYLEPGSIYSGNGVQVLPTFYYDYGPVLKLTFPVTINLYNNVSVLNGRDQVTFGYRVVDSAGTFQGVYDTVAFNNTGAPASPPFLPEFEVSGTTPTPIGLLYDSELIFGGPGGGSNAVFNNLSGTESLSYSNQSSGGWTSVPSAYDFGGDTGETAIGVAETWSPGGTVGLSAGPSLLYGLWNSQPSTAVPSGSIEFQGTMAPSYGFAFVGSPFYYYNTSYLPTNINGGFETFLPPGATYYAYFVADGYMRAVGSFSSTFTGVSVSLTASAHTLTAPLYVDGNAQAQAAATAISGWSSGPYAFQNLNLLSTVGSYFDPLFFNRLNDWGFVSFNLFQATGVTHAINVTHVLQGEVNWTSSDTTDYYFDAPARGSPASLLGLPPALSNNLSQYGELTAFYSDSAVQVSNEETIGYIAGSSLDPSGYYNLNPAGGAVVLWNSSNADISGIVSLFGSYGAWVAGSPGLTFFNGVSEIGANALSLAGSSDAKVNLVVSLASVSWSNHEGPSTQDAYGVFDLGSSGGTFTNITAVAGAFGFVSLDGTGATVNHVEAAGLSPNITGFSGYAEGVLLEGASHTSVNDTTAFPSSIGVAAAGTLGTQITNVTGAGSGFSTSAVALYLDGSDWTNVTHLQVSLTAVAGFWDYAQNTTLKDALYADVDYATYDSFYDAQVTLINVTVVDSYVGPWFEDVSGVTANFLNATNDDWGFDFTYATGGAITNVNSTGSYVGVLLDEATGFTVTNVLANDTTTTSYYGGIEVDDSMGNSVSNVVAEDDAIGVHLDYGASDNTVTMVTSEFDSVGVELGGSPSSGAGSGNTVSGVTVTDESSGVQVIDSPGNTVTDVTATDYSAAVIVDPSAGVGVSDVSVTDNSVGVIIAGSWDDTVSGTTASGLSLAVIVLGGSYSITVTHTTVSNASIGVFVTSSGRVVIDGVTATNTTLDTPWNSALISDFGSPLAAVSTYYAYQVQVSNVTATNYPIGLYDDESGWGDYGPGSLFVTNLNATGGVYGVLLNYTGYAYFYDISAYHDQIGFYSYDTEYTELTMSSFVDNSGFGVMFVDGYYSYVWNNDFIGNNGATGTYNAAHIQAFSTTSSNYFDGPGSYYYVGNYWADWHSWNADGYLNPYYVGSDDWDYYPLGTMAGQYEVLFYSDGLASGVPWSVTFNGATQTTTADWLLFGAAAGVYSYSVGAVPGYTVSPSAGSISTATGPVEVDLSYTAVYNVTLTETGLPSGQSWSAILNGVTASSTTSSIVFSAPSGTFNYQVLPVAGYTAAPSAGTVTVGTSPYSLAVSFTAVTYAVTVTENGLPSGTSWSATVNGVTQTSVGASVTFYLPNGTYTYSVANVNGYSMTGGTGSVTVNGAPAAAAVAFTPSTSPSLVSSNTYNTGLAIALAIAAIAIVLALLALLWRHKAKPAAAPAPPNAWTPPEGAAGAPPPTTGTNPWSEGAGTPPS
jgi:hypothetical protein